MLSVAMQTHPCYAFHQRMINCIKSEDMASRMCFNEIDDWHECTMRAQTPSRMVLCQEMLTHISQRAPPREHTTSDC